jgi:adenylate cyclase
MSEERVDRKLTAILSADVVGYSRLMGEDDAATVATLGAYRKLFVSRIEAHRGRVVDAKGDALLAEFGSVVNAVACAAEVQREIAERNVELPEERRMRFRIGVNLGDVIVQDEALYGDGVNIAARLEALAEPGGICISGAAHAEVENKLPLEFEFQGKQQVKNITNAVPVYRVLSLPGAAAARVLRAGRLRARLKLHKGKIVGLAMAAIFVLGLIAAEAYISRLRQPAVEDDPVLAMPGGPTIAVLPFDNLSGDPEQEYFSDGLTEQIIADLSRFPELHVLARNSTGQYKGKSVDVRDIGTNLGADYVIEGSVRRGETRVRVTAQLVKTADGSHLWAESYDRELTGSDLLDIQEGITGQIVAKLGDSHGVINLARLEQVRGKAATDLDAYQCQLRVIQYYSALTPRGHLQARTCIEQALERSPDNPDLLAWQSSLILDEHRFGFNPRPNPLPRAVEAVKRAIALDRNHHRAHNVNSQLQHLRRNLDGFLVASERAVALNPSHATTLVSNGLNMISAGKLERGMALASKGIALNPDGAGWYYFAPQHYHYARGEYEKALAAALKVNTPRFFLHPVVLAADYAQLGRMEEAQAEVEKLLALYPDFGANARVELEKFFWNFEALLEGYLDGLRKAGLKIPDEPEDNGDRNKSVRLEWHLHSDPGRLG